MERKENEIQSHVCPIRSGSLDYSGDLGEILSITARELPVLRNLSVRRLTLRPGAVREPHWHANAVELGYCLQGSATVGILDNKNMFAAFTIAAGQMFCIPSGAVHHIENIGNEDAVFVVAFRHELPEDFSFAAALGAMSDAVLGNTYGFPTAAFAAVPRSTEARKLVAREAPAVVPEAAKLASPYKFDVEAQPPQLRSAAGEVRFARSQLWPALENIALYSLRVSTQGMREPHWHPETAEMGYVHSGNARMTVMDPNGGTDTYLLQPGDVYFVPRAYPHHIEQMGDEPIHFLIFFDQPMPQDIGYRASATAFSRDVLAASLKLPAANLPELPFTPSDPLLVTRINPRDP